MCSGKAAVDQEAARLICAYGENAYEQAEMAFRLSLKRRDPQMSSFLAAVMGAVQIDVGTDPRAAPSDTQELRIIIQ